MTNIKLTKRKKGLSDRVRPDSEAAPWVIEEIKKLETKIAAFEKDAAMFLAEHDENVKLHFENVELKEQNARFRKVLEFYAVKGLREIRFGQRIDQIFVDAMHDSGAVARAALEGK